ncbi:MAG: BrnT family toxin [Ignavibacteria bacterium]|nr:BrnT family toxin [Ignavibacteria bacterium]
MIFLWDDRKAGANEKKHGVTFQEASTVFGDPLAVSFDDPDHSENEERFLTFGMSLNGRLLVIAHTGTGDTVRMIRARVMTNYERSVYEEA